MLHQTSNQRRLNLGLFKRDQLNEGYKYSIESVRVPKERIQLYKTGALAGPWDIALIRLRDSVPFIPHKVPPVSLNISKIVI